MRCPDHSYRLEINDPRGPILGRKNGRWVKLCYPGECVLVDDKTVVLTFQTPHGIDPRTYRQIEVVSRITYDFEISIREHFDTDPKTGRTWLVEEQKCERYR